MRLIDADAFIHEMFDYSAPEMMWNKEDIIYKIGKMETVQKEQEAVEPTFKQDNDGIFVWACGSCGAYTYHIYDGIDKAKEYAKYCRQCGKKVKWE